MGVRVEEKDTREVAIEVTNLNKVYKMNDKPTHRFKEALRLTRKPLSYTHLTLPTKCSL